ncbi:MULTISPECIES: ATP-binding protein [Thermodesulfovibrio]|jgi:signal transduction histidine kinase|uniref:ATP-binding protein n=1 Tax=Thermodesulfovibrio TaxID=28261 RepID=UPI002636F231|nr:ATP-binding protein [Thermodesulfovibrio sp.]
MKRIEISIKWLFVIVIVLLIAGTSISNYIFSYHLYKKNIAENINNIAENLKLNTDKFTTTIETFLYNMQGLVCCGIINFNEVEKTNNFLIHFMQKFTYVTSINYGDGRGNGYLILHDGDRWLNRIKRVDKKGYVYWHSLNREGKIINTEIKADDYDPRSTTWYGQALNSDGIQWSREYIFRTTKDPGITASMLLCSKNGEVIGVDVMIKDFSLFLNETSKKLITGSELYLLSNGKHIVAFVNNIFPEKGRIYEVNEREFPHLYSALYAIEKDRKLKIFEFKGKKWFLNVNKWYLGSREMSLVVLIPHSSVIASLNLYSFYQILLSLFIAFLILIYLTKNYTYPMIEMSEEIKNLGTKPINLENYANRKDEIGILSRAIVDASYQLIEKRELEQKLTKAGQFEAVKRSLHEAVHRFKDLINAIQGFAILARNKITDSFAINSVDQIINASKKAIYLTKEILTLTAERKYEIKKTDLNSLLSTMKSKIESFMGDEIKTEFVLYEGALIAGIDTEAFSEAIINILANAKEAMPEGGTLTIKTEMTNISDKSYALIVIKDTGIGMDKETKERVFEPFFTTKGAKGTGLGLPITYRIILDHGGFIELDSETNIGTTFRIYLPLYSEEV